jgi:GPH family glycoside/pentoside/hexuronide:cation symporter
VGRRQRPARRQPQRPAALALGAAAAFLLFGSIPFALTFFLMFVVPPFESQTALVLYYSIVFLLYDTLYTVVNVPYLALVPELTDEYDERSSLTGWRTGFSFLAQLVTAGTFKLLAEHVFAPWFGGGPDGLRAGFLLAAGLWALSMAPAVRAALPGHPRAGGGAGRLALRPVANFARVRQSPFRLAALIYLLCFTTGDVILVVLVRYLVDYVQVDPGFDNIVLVTVLAVSLFSIPAVLALMRRTNKRTAYLIGIGFMVVVLSVGAFVPPGAQNRLLFRAGRLGFAAMSIIPGPSSPTSSTWMSCAPVSGAEGLYTGYLVFLRKFGTGVLVFGVGQLLAFSGYVSSTTGSAFIEQPAAALNAMRFLVTVVPAVALSLSLVLAWRFPIDRASHEAVRRALDERRASRVTSEEVGSV